MNVDSDQTIVRLCVCEEEKEARRRTVERPCAEASFSREIDFVQRFTAGCAGSSIDKALNPFAIQLQSAYPCNEPTLGANEQLEVPELERELNRFEAGK